MKTNLRLACLALAATVLASCGSVAHAATTPAPIAVPAVTFTVGGPAFATPPAAVPHAWLTCQERGLAYPC